MKLALSLATALATFGTAWMHPIGLSLADRDLAGLSGSPTAAPWLSPTPSSAAAAQSASAGAQGPTASKPEKPSGPMNPCVEACWKNYEKKVDFCHERSWVCDFSILGICLSKHQNPVFLQDCQDAALEVYQACKQACTATP